MTETIKDWIDRYFSDPQVISLAAVLVGGFAIVYFAGGMLAPVFASIVIAYLLESLVGLIERSRLPRLVAVLVVFLAFMALLLFVIFWLIPLLSSQASELLQQLPAILGGGQELLLALPEKYPDLISKAQVIDLIAQIRTEALRFGQQALEASLSSALGVLALLVYLILMPLMVFFFLKDKITIIEWVKNFLPSDRSLTGKVWADVDIQLGNYVRGKVIEILIVWITCYATFALMGLQFSMLLGALVGLSVVIPYVGAVTVTFPVAIIGYFQWGFSDDFAWLMIAYTIIQILDGNVLVPLLFSEVVNLHPVAIVVAVLVFGGLWGFWGIFFAIPLATAVQAILKAWPPAKVSGEQNA